MNILLLRILFLLQIILKMKKTHKNLIVESLFGLIEGSARALEEAIKDDFLLDFNLVPEKIEVIGTDKFIKNESIKVWRNFCRIR